MCVGWKDEGARRWAWGRVKGKDGNGNDGCTFMFACSVCRQEKQIWQQEKGRSGRRVRGMSIGTSDLVEYDWVCVDRKGGG